MYTFFDNYNESTIYIFRNMCHVHVFSKLKKIYISFVFVFLKQIENRKN